MDFSGSFLEQAQDKRLITDMENVMGYPNYHDFIAHKHDLSIFSLLSKKAGLESFRDPSQFGNDVMASYPNSPYEQLINLTRARSVPLPVKIRRRLEKWRGDSKKKTEAGS